MSVSYASIATQLHERYHDKAIEIWNEQNDRISPFVTQMEIKPWEEIQDSFGRGYVIPFSYARGGAVSNTFASSRAISYGSSTGHAASNDRWVVTPFTKHATANWTREAILSAAKSKEKLYDVMKNEIDARLGKLKLRMAIDLFEGGYGRAATITAAPTSSTITVNTALTNRFEIGDSIVAAATLTGALRSATARIITGIDPDTGVLTLDGDPTTLSWANGDIVFFLGDHTDSVLTAPVGLQGYLPDAAPTTALFGVTRTNNPAVSGRRVNCSSYNTLQAIMVCAERLANGGGVPSQCFISTRDFMNMSYDKDRVKIMEQTVGKLNAGFTVAKVLSPGGSVDVMGEMLMEPGRLYMGDFKSVHAPFIVHTDDLINVDNFSGAELKDIDGVDAYEMRWYSRISIAFPGPGKFMVGHSIP